MGVAKRLENFGIRKLIYHNRNVSEEAARCGFEYVDLDTLLRTSDFVVCTCSPSKEMENFFDRNKFERMKRSAIFVNVSRGFVVNQDDLVYALKNGLIAAAGFYFLKRFPSKFIKEKIIFSNLFKSKRNRCSQSRAFTD